MTQILKCYDIYTCVSKDVEAALLEGSPTMSFVSSDFTDRTYVALVDDAIATPTGSPTTTTTTMIEPVHCGSPGLGAAKCLTDTESEDDNLIVEELTPVVIISRQSAPRPKFRIRPPYLMICISIIEIAVHCLGDEATLREWLVYDPRQRLQGWRFISYMLLHSDALHLALNVVIQLLLATPLEVEQGRLAVWTIYLGGGVCGALGASLLQPNLYLVGASAGVYALLTSHLSHLYLCHGELRYASWRLLAVLLLAAADVASFPVPGLMSLASSSSSSAVARGSRIGWESHLAGALAGPLLGLACFPHQSKKDARGRRFVRFVRLCSAVSLTLLVVGAILGNVYMVALPQLRRPS
ncbi:hypothetical protein TKK_0003666 [Trichogramma kaykai]|uniref:Peptidase S54 rhomboid domain-containing protein n=1 Tax=Trichogramma kaykai TaxID=54128 RepID=A0ABD2XP12_9HYME